MEIKTDLVAVVVRETRVLGLTDKGYGYFGAIKLP